MESTTIESNNNVGGDRHGGVLVTLPPPQMPNWDPIFTFTAPISSSSSTQQMHRLFDALPLELIQNEICMYLTMHDMGLLRRVSKKFEYIAVHAFPSVALLNQHHLQHLRDTYMGRNITSVVSGFVAFTQLGVYIFLIMFSDRIGSFASASASITLVGVAAMCLNVLIAIVFTKIFEWVVLLLTNAVLSRSKKHIRYEQYMTCATRYVQRHYFLMIFIMAFSLSIVTAKLAAVRANKCSNNNNNNSSLEDGLLMQFIAFAVMCVFPHALVSCAHVYCRKHGIITFHHGNIHNEKEMENNIFLQHDDAVRLHEEETELTKRMSRVFWVYIGVLIIVGSLALIGVGLFCGISSSSSSSSCDAPSSSICVRVQKVDAWISVSCGFTWLLCYVFRGYLCRLCLRILHTIQAQLENVD